MKTCEHCGETCEEVELRIDPYHHEIDDNEELVLLCLDCYNDLLYSI